MTPASATGSTLTGSAPRFEVGFKRLAPGVWAWLQPNGAWGEANAGLVAGDGASLLVDTLWDERLAGEMLAAAAELEAPPIRVVVNTHSDGDHWWGNGVVPAESTIVTSQASARAMAAEAAPQELARLARLTARGRRLPGRMGTLSRYTAGMLAPFQFARVHPRRPDATFAETKTLEVGGREVRLTLVGPAHTPGDLIVHVPDAAVVFAADVLFVNATPVMWHGPIENWLRALDTLIELEADTYVPGHGPDCGVDGVRAFRELMERIRDGALECHHAGLGAQAATRRMLAGEELAELRGWECPERLYITVAALYRGFEGAKRLPTTPLGRARVFAVVGRIAQELEHG